LQLLQPQLQLLDLLRQLLRLTAKLHALQFGQQQLEMVDLSFARKQLLVLRSDQRFQRFRGKKIQIGKRCD
jgi:hypothetical protein